MSEYNSTCPFCGTEGEMRATAHSTDSNVPLRANGFSTEDGNPEGSELTDVVCGHCNREVDANHYLGHGEAGEPCDCVETAETGDGL